MQLGPVWIGELALKSGGDEAFSLLHLTYCQLLKSHPSLSNHEVSSQPSLGTNNSLYPKLGSNLGVNLLESLSKVKQKWTWGFLNEWFWQRPYIHPPNQCGFSCGPRCLWLCWGGFVWAKKRAILHVVKSSWVCIAPPGKNKVARPSERMGLDETNWNTSLSGQETGIVWGDPTRVTYKSNWSQYFANLTCLKKHHDHRQNCFGTSQWRAFYMELELYGDLLCARWQVDQVTKPVHE